MAAKKAFPYCQELMEKALKIKHRRQRALETGRFRAAARAEMDVMRLSNEIEAATKVTQGYFAALTLLAAMKYLPVVVPVTSAARAVPRKSYSMDSWLERRLPKLEA